MRVDKIKLEPLGSKWYSTRIEVEVGGNGWDKPGYPLYIEIGGMGSRPSVREYELGYLPDEDMNHVESEEVYQLAHIIMEALRKENNS